MLLESFFQIAGVLPEAMFLVANDGRLLSANSAARELLGSPQSEQTSLLEVTCDPPQKVIDFLRLCSRTTEFTPGALNFRIQGSPEPLRCRCEGALLRTSSGEGGEAAILLRLLPAHRALARFGALNDKVEALGREITERMRAEQEVRRLHAELSGVIQSSPIGIAVFDLDRTVRLLNPAAERMLGWRLSELAGRALPLPADCRAQWEVLVETLKQGEPFINIETRRLRKDGAEFDASVSGSPIFDASGHTIGFIGTIQDITERKLAEAALLRSEKMAATGRLAATISHEINNPLEAITNLAYLLSTDTSLSSQARHYVETMMQELSRISRIVKETLGLYRDTKAPVIVNIRQLSEDILKLFERRIRAKRLRFAMDFSGDLQVEAFPGDLRQVFSNLLINAMDAVGEEGCVHLTASGNSRVVRVAIRDDGPGIPEQLRARLFEPFFSTKAEKGTGLGLWVSSGIVHKHGGQILLDSSTDPDVHGTTFTVILPRRYADAAATIGETSQTDASRQDAVSFAS